jgi:hypothetical protein
MVDKDNGLTCPHNLLELQISPFRVDAYDIHDFDRTMWRLCARKRLVDDNEQSYCRKFPLVCR